MEVTKKYLDELTYKVIGCAIEVHKYLSTGRLESIYEKFLLRELKIRGINCVNIFKEGQRGLVNNLFFEWPEE